MHDSEDRTVRFLQELGFAEPPEALRILQNTEVEVYFAPSRCRPNQLTAGDVAVRLLARCTSRLTVTDPGRVIPTDVIEDWQDLASNLGVSIRLNEKGEGAVPLVIGEMASQDGQPAVYALSDGWAAYTGRVPPTIAAAPQENPIGAMMAGALAVSEVFKEAISRGPYNDEVPPQIEGVWLSAYDYSRPHTGPLLPRDVDIGQVVLVGAGAVGCAFAYALKNLPRARGRLVVLDPDRVDETNLNRYILVDRRYVNRPKVEVVKQAVSRTDLGVVAVPLHYQEFKDRFGWRPLDVVVCTVDNDDSRRDLQSDLPRVILNGATTGSTAMVSRHDFLGGACLGCVYPRADDSLTVEEALAGLLGCSVGTVLDMQRTDRPLSDEEAGRIAAALNWCPERARSLEGRSLWDLCARELCGYLHPVRAAEPQPAGAVGFVSFLSGLLLLAELVKEVAGLGGRLRNRFQMNVLTGPSAHSVFFQSKRDDCPCFCGESSVRAVYLERYGSVGESA